MSKQTEEKEKEEEEWRNIPGNEIYEVSNLGQVRNKRKILKKQITEGGYERIGLSLQKKKQMHRVHRLVALAFILNPNDFPDVNHKDKNRANN